MMDVPRRFYLLRQFDKSQVSGLGRVADGVWFSSGWVALGWHGAWAVAHPWPSLAAVRAVHGHEGDTRIVWLDPDRDGRWVSPDGSAADWFEVLGHPLVREAPQRPVLPPLRTDLPRMAGGRVDPPPSAAGASGPSSVTSSGGATEAGARAGVASRRTSGSLIPRTPPGADAASRWIAAARVQEAPGLRPGPGESSTRAVGE